MQEYPAPTREAASCPDLHGCAIAFAGFSREIYQQHGGGSSIGIDLNSCLYKLKRGSRTGETKKKDTPPACREKPTRLRNREEKETPPGCLSHIREEKKDNPPSCCRS
jgi:hypothetical protein